MAMGHAAPRQGYKLTSILTTDFCPWANRFVYWLKEPVGWLFVAMNISVIVGLYFSPVGWSIASALLTLMLVGIAWPWVAVRAVKVELSPGTPAMNEESSCVMVVKVRNRLPIPIWGLAVEGFFDPFDADQVEQEVHAAAVVPFALASVPPLCRAEYQIEVSPRLRGCYPKHEPQVCCAFPFAIWTARRKLADSGQVIVWPKLYEMNHGQVVAGRLTQQCGEGSCPDRSGDFLGTREFRRGDSARQVNWVASAKLDSLIVNERGGPRQSHLNLWVDTVDHGDGIDELSQRMRVAASVITAGQQKGVSMSVTVGDRTVQLTSAVVSTRTVLDRLAMVPLEGCSCRSALMAAGRADLLITGTQCELFAQRLSKLAGQPAAWGGLGTLLQVTHRGALSGAGVVVQPEDLADQQMIAKVVAAIWKEIGNVQAAA